MFCLPGLLDVPKHRLVSSTIGRDEIHAVHLPLGGGSRQDRDMERAGDGKICRPSEDTQVWRC